MARKSRRQKQIRKQSESQPKQNEPQQAADLVIGEEVIERIVQKVSISFAGPLPHPQTLKQYEDT